MTRWIRVAGYILLINWLTAGNLQGQQDLFDYEHSLEFARYLQSSRQFEFATEEFERLNYFYPGEPEIRMELVETYRLDENCGQLDRALHLLQEDSPVLHVPLTREYLNFCLTCGRSRSGYMELAGKLGSSEEAFYTLSYYWRTSNYDSAFSYNREAGSLLQQRYSGLYDLTIQFEQQHYKSPFLALILSAVLPGSGKAYSKRWGDAAVSFLFVSTAAYASYRAFNRKGIRSFNGWLMGGIAFSFYSSNLYGSFRAAKQYNREVVTSYQNEAKNIIYSNF